VLWTRVRIFDTNRLAEGVPQVNEVSDDEAFAHLRSGLLRQQGRANASLDARDLRFDSRAQTIAVFLVERINAIVLNVFDDLVMPARILGGGARLRGSAVG
jgi:hypothetical protein